MLLTDYVTYDGVRAALGVAPEELEDTTLALKLYVDVLQVELEDIDLTLPDLYTTTKAVPTPTAPESRFPQSAQLFATYVVARHLLGSISLFAPKDITDGKTATARVGDPYRELRADIQAQYDRFKARLEATFEALTSTTVTTAVTKSYFAIASPSTDPVTGV